MHLLEKEPDNRYQTADGLIYDPERLGTTGAALRVGERDFPVRLLPLRGWSGVTTKLHCCGRRSTTQSRAGIAVCLSAGGRSREDGAGR